MTMLVLGFALLTVDVVLDGPVRRADPQVAGWVAAHVHGAAWWLARVLAGFGQRAFDAVPLGLAATIAAVRGRRWRPIVWTCAVLAVLAVGVQGLKIAFGRTGPGGQDAIFAGGLEYPSGHTINGIVMWGMILQLLHDLGGASGRWLTPRRRAALCSMTGFATGVGLVAVNWHWLSDVLAGWLLGPPALWLALRAYRHLRDAPPSPRAAGLGSPNQDRARQLSRARRQQHAIAQHAYAVVREVPPLHRGGATAYDAQDGAARRDRGRASSGSGEHQLVRRAPD